MKYCEKCGSKVSDGALFCEKCGHKVKNNQQKTKFCKKCGKEIDIDANICPNCGAKLKESFYNVKIKKYLTKRNISIVVAIICLAIFLIYLPSTIEFLTPYKEVNSTYIENPVVGEKVKISGIYLGEDDLVSKQNIFQVGNQYVPLYKYGDATVNGVDTAYTPPEGSKLTLEGKFISDEKSSYYINSKLISGYSFRVNNIITS